MSAHTPGKLGIAEASAGLIKLVDFMGETSVIIASASGLDNSGYFPSVKEGEANARRLVAAWNACEGIETYALELMTGDLSIESQIKPAFKPVKVEAKHACDAAINEANSWGSNYWDHAAAINALKAKT